MFPLQYIGRMFKYGAVYEIAADEQWNFENANPKYERILWKGYELYIVDLQHRYEIEVARERKERITAFEDYMNNVTLQRSLEF
jgi:hypothetical protein